MTTLWEKTKQRTLEWEQKYATNLSKWVECRTCVKNGHSLTSLFATQDLPQGSLLGCYPHADIIPVRRLQASSEYDLDVKTFDSESDVCLDAVLVVSEDERKQEPLLELCEPSAQKEYVNTTFATVLGTFAVAVVTLVPIAKGEELLIYYGPMFPRGHTEYEMKYQFRVGKEEVCLTRPPRIYSALLYGTEKGDLEIGVQIKALKKSLLVTFPVVQLPKESDT